MNTFTPEVLAIATALAGAAAFAYQSAGFCKNQVLGSAGFNVINKFLADSRQYLGL